MTVISQPLQRSRSGQPVLSAGRLKVLIILLPYLWMSLFFLAPFFVIIKISLAESIVGTPPFTPLFEMVDGAREYIGSIDNFIYIVGDNSYAEALFTSFLTAAGAALACLAIGYPAAYAVARAPRRYRTPLLLALVLPFWTSFLLRVYAWIGLLDTYGPINQFLMKLGLIDQPLIMLHTNFAVYLGIVYTYLPFMILPLYSTLERLDQVLDEAATDLGATPLRVFTDVTLPLSLPGILAGCFMVFIPAMGEYVIPTLLGDARSLMIGRKLYDEFFVNHDWPTASAVTILMLLIVVPPVVFLQRQSSRQE